MFDRKKIFFRIIISFIRVKGRLNNKGNKWSNTIENEYKFNELLHSSFSHLPVFQRNDKWPKTRIFVEKKEFLGMIIEIKEKKGRKELTIKDDKTKKKSKGNVGFICRIIITIVQIHKSANFALSFVSRVHSCMVYCSAKFPVTSAFHVESVHKTHSYCLCMGGWVCNTWGLTITNSKGFSVLCKVTNCIIEHTHYNF